MSHESTRCISILLYTNKHDKTKNDCVILENIRKCIVFRIIFGVLI